MYVCIYIHIYIYHIYQQLFEDFEPQPSQALPSFMPMGNFDLAERPRHWMGVIPSYTTYT